MRTLVILCTLLMPGLLFAEGSSSYAMFGRGGETLTISYNIADAGGVFEQMLDIVRGGRVVEIDHAVSIYSKPGWRKKRLQRVLAQRFLSYDPLTDRFAISGTQGPVQDNLTPEEAANRIFQITDLPLVDVDRVIQAGEYPVKIVINYSVQGADRSMLDWISLSGLWQDQSVKAEVTYLAR